MSRYLPFRSSRELLSVVIACALLVGQFLLTAQLRADDEKPGKQPGQTESEPETKTAEEEKPDDAETKPKPRPETREERRQRIRNQARNGMGSPTTLIGIPQIQRELELSEEQQREIADQTRRMQLYVRSQAKDISDLPRDQQSAAMRQLYARTRPYINRKKKDMMQVLSEEQRARLLGISLQMRGARSLIDEEIIELLELTDEQVEAILVILEDYDLKLQKTVLRSPQNAGQPLVVVRPAGSRNQMNADAEKEILAVLTEEQRRKFSELQGEPYEAEPSGQLPTLIERPENDKKKTLKELDSDN